MLVTLFKSHTQPGLDLTDDEMVQSGIKFIRK